MIKRELLQSVVDRHMAVSRVFDGLSHLIGATTESPLWEETWKALDLAASLVSEKVGDKFDSLAWFIHENDCGARGREAGPTGDMRPIRTVDDLLWLIEVAA